jgi:hypothetical protein
MIRSDDRDGGNGRNRTMKRLLGPIVVAAALLGSAAPVEAATIPQLRHDCRKGDADACQEYAFRLCVRRVERKGYSHSEAVDLCGG